MGSYGIPPKLVRMVRAMYKGSKCVVIGGGKTGWFDTLNQVFDKGVECRGFSSCLSLIG